MFNWRFFTDSYLHRLNLKTFAVSTLFEKGAVVVRPQCRRFELVLRRCEVI